MASKLVPVLESAQVCVYCSAAAVADSMLGAALHRPAPGDCTNDSSHCPLLPHLKLWGQEAEREEAEASWHARMMSFTSQVPRLPCTHVAVHRRVS